MIRLRKTALVLGTFLLILLAVRPVSADVTPADGPPEGDAAGFQHPDAPDTPGEAAAELVWEFDPYYTQVSLHFPLTDAPIPTTTNLDELRVYRKLFVDSLIPRFALVEAAVFPMPLLGVAAHSYAPDFYRSFNVGSGNLNLLESITAGFQEPYAFSLFLGDMISFIRPGETKVSTNKGYMGYMLSYSNQHIKKNVMLPDHNLEVEWKTKGDRIFPGQKLSWSFRFGAKLHEHRDISNTVYFGLRRSNLDFDGGMFEIFRNSDMDFRWDFSAQDARLLRQEYVVGKKFPIKSWKLAFRMAVGLIWEDRAIYSGSLRDRDFQSLTAVLRPNIEF